jgi:hypothetical protein
VNRDASFECGERAGQPVVRGEQFCRLSTLASVEASVGQGDSGLLGENAQEELLAYRRLGIGADGKEPEVRAEATQAERPPPLVATDGDGPACRAHDGELRFDVRQEVALGRVPGRQLPSVIEEKGAEKTTARERRHGGARQAEDLTLVFSVGHPHGQGEQGLQTRELLPQGSDVFPAARRSG